MPCAWPRTAGRRPGEQIDGERKVMGTVQTHLGKLDPRGVIGGSGEPGPGAGHGVGCRLDGLDGDPGETLGRLFPERKSRGQRSDPGQAVQRGGGLSDPAEIHLDLRELWVEAGQREVLGGADGDGLPISPIHREAPHPSGTRLLTDPAAPRVHRLGHGASERGSGRWPGGRTEGSGEVVADIHSDGSLPRLRQGQGCGEVAGNEVVAKGRDEPGHGRMGAVELEHGPDERRLAGGVDVPGAAIDRGIGNSV